MAKNNLEEVFFRKKVAEHNARGINAVEVREMEPILEIKSEDISKKVIFLRPIPPNEYFSLGDLAISVSTNVNMQKRVAEERCICIKETFSPKHWKLLQPPRSYTLVWESKVRNQRDASAQSTWTIWRPVGPPGYIALGDVISTTSKPPSLDLPYRLVHSSVLFNGHMATGGGFDNNNNPNSPLPPSSTLWSTNSFPFVSEISLWSYINPIDLKVSQKSQNSTTSLLTNSCRVFPSPSSISQFQTSPSLYQSMTNFSQIPQSTPSSSSLKPSSSSNLSLAANNNNRTLGTKKIGSNSNFFYSSEVLSNGNLFKANKLIPTQREAYYLPISVGQRSQIQDSYFSVIVLEDYTAKHFCEISCSKDMMLIAKGGEEWVDFDEQVWIKCHNMDDHETGLIPKSITKYLSVFKMLSSNDRLPILRGYLKLETEGSYYGKSILNVWAVIFSNAELGFFTSIEEERKDTPILRFSLSLIVSVNPVYIDDKYRFEIHTSENTIQVIADSPETVDLWFKTLYFEISKMVDLSIVNQKKSIGFREKFQEKKKRAIIKSPNSEIDGQVGAFGTCKGEEIHNKYDILSEIDRVLGFDGPPAIEYIYCEPYTSIDVYNYQFSKNPYGHASIRYTKPNGKQILMNIVGLKGESLVHFIDPTEYLFGTNFDASIGNEQCGIYNRSFVGLRIQHLSDEKVMLMHKYFKAVKKQAENQKLGYKFFSFFGNQKGNCAMWTTLGMKRCGLLPTEIQMPKKILEILYNEVEASRDPAVFHNIALVYYERIQFLKPVDGSLPKNFPHHGYGTSTKFNNIRDLANVIVRVPENSKSASVTLNHQIEPPVERPKAMKETPLFNEHFWHEQCRIKVDHKQQLIKKYNDEFIYASDEAIIFSLTNTSIQFPDYQSDHSKPRNHSLFDHIYFSCTGDIIYITNDGLKIYYLENRSSWKALNLSSIHLKENETIITVATDCLLQSLIISTSLGLLYMLISPVSESPSMHPLISKPSPSVAYKQVVILNERLFLLLTTPFKVVDEDNDIRIDVSSSFSSRSATYFNEIYSLCVINFPSTYYSSASENHNNNNNNNSNSNNDNNNNNHNNNNNNGEKKRKKPTKRKDIQVENILTKITDSSPPFLQIINTEENLWAVNSDGDLHCFPYKISDDANPDHPQANKFTDSYFYDSILIPHNRSHTLQLQLNFAESKLGNRKRISKLFVDVYDLQSVFGLYSPPQSVDDRLNDASVTECVVYKLSQHRLIVKSTCSLEKIWDSSSLPSSQTISFFKPKCNDGYLKFGDVLENTKLGFASTVCLLAKEIEDPSDIFSPLRILSPPTHFYSPFEFDEKCKVWIAETPKGYLSLGRIITYNEQYPSSPTECFTCLHSAFVAPASILTYRQLDPNITPLSSSPNIASKSSPSLSTSPPNPIVRINFESSSPSIPSPSPSSSPSNPMAIPVQPSPSSPLFSSLSVFQSYNPSPSAPISLSPESPASLSASPSKVNFFSLFPYSNVAPSSLRGYVWSSVNVKTLPPCSFWLVAPPLVDNYLLPNSFVFSLSHSEAPDNEAFCIRTELHDEL